MTLKQSYPLNHREFVVLGLVGEEPSHAYKIDKKIDDRGMREWTSIGTSSIYSDLNTLEINGLVESYTEEHDNRIRRVYKITDFGWKILEVKIFTVLKEFQGKNDEDFYVAFSMLPVLSKEKQMEAISHSINIMKSHVKELEEMLEQNSSMPLNVTGLFIHPIKILETDINFLEWLMNQIENGRGTVSPNDHVKE